jgi:transcriptional regulator with XRE-family HTH domain
MKRKSDIKGYIAERTGGKVTARYVLVRFAGRVAAQLDELRREQGLSQQDLADRLDTSKAQINRLLSGDYTGMTIKSMSKVAAALGVVVDPVIHEAVPAPRTRTTQRRRSRRIVRTSRQRERQALIA